ncbi:hypothetical protein [Streptomyces synnematoformans]|uniref:Uncharacterized protein n=1 Tax=Streptomyces synnematoformans TaxID=415721 RepID=A0ABN2XB23_9ACTN
MLRGERTWRWLRVLLQHLPPESHTMTALRNAAPEEELAEASEAAEPEKGRWSTAEQLLALLVDVQRQHLYAFSVANSDPKKRKKDKPPEPIPRPGVQQPKKKTAPMSDAAAEVLFNLINGPPPG